MPPSVSPSRSNLKNLRVADVLKFFKDYWSIFAWLGSLVLAVVSTIWATTQAVQSRLKVLERHLPKAIALEEWNKEMTLNLVVSNLRILEIETERMRKFVAAWERPEFKMEALDPRQPREKSLVPTKPYHQLPRSYDLMVYASVALNLQSRAVRDPEIGVALLEILRDFTRYNAEFVSNNRVFMGMTAPPGTPGITHGTPRFNSMEDAKQFAQDTDALIKQLETRLERLPRRIAEERGKIETLYRRAE